LVRHRAGLNWLRAGFLKRRSEDMDWEWEIGVVVEYQSRSVKKMDTISKGRTGVTLCLPEIALVARVYNFKLRQPGGWWPE
jgi:hypothetical protein